MELTLLALGKRRGGCEARLMSGDSMSSMNGAGEATSRGFRTELQCFQVAAVAVAEDERRRRERRRSGRMRRMKRRRIGRRIGSRMRRSGEEGEDGDGEDEYDSKDRRAAALEMKALWAVLKHPAFEANSRNKCLK